MAAQFLVSPGTNMMTTDPNSTFDKKNAWSFSDGPRGYTEWRKDLQKALGKAGVYKL